MQLFVNDLTVIDASYLCAERGMVGESWIVDVILSGGLDHQNMVLDFGKVKKRLKQLIDESVDHKLLIPALHPAVVIGTASDSAQRVTMATAKGAMLMQMPAQGMALLPCQRIEPATVATYLQTLLPAVLPDNVEQIELKLRHEVIPTPYYHYSHGLKKHDGNCQRIAHGHRSMIEIWHQQQRCPELEAGWAARWQDIYLASQEDVMALTELALADEAATLTASHVGFAYQAAQGWFELVMPKAVVAILAMDTTVECLTQYIATTVKTEQQLSGEVRVCGYEGVGKGAIAWA